MLQQNTIQIGTILEAKKKNREKARRNLPAADSDGRAEVVNGDGKTSRSAKPSKITAPARARSAGARQKNESIVIPDRRGEEDSETQHINLLRAGAEEFT